MQRLFNIWKFINLINYINKLKWKRTQDYFIRCWKTVLHNSKSLHVKSLGMIRNPRPILNHCKTIYSKPFAIIKLNGEKFEEVPLKSQTWQSCTLSPYLYNIVLEVLATAIRQQKVLEVIKIEKKEGKLCHLQMIW